MKTTILLFAIVMLALGSCETIEIEKLIYDTVYVKSPPVMSFVQTVTVDTVYKELIHVDTVEVSVVVHDTLINEVMVHDTVYQIKTDSVFIERVVERVINHHDTIVQVQTINHTDTIYIDKIVTIHDTITVIEYEQRVVYQSIQFVFPGQSVFYVADEFLTYYNDYHQAAADRGKLLPGGDLVLTRVDPDKLPGENWVSNFYIVAGDQAIIEISEQLPIEQCRAAIYREMTRWQLKKKYSNDINRVICPLFRTSPDPTVSEINQLFL